LALVVLAEDERMVVLVVLGVEERCDQSEEGEARDQQSACEPEQAALRVGGMHVNRSSLAPAARRRCRW
jgi:hypothetical protein